MRAPVVEAAPTKPEATSADQHREEAQACVVLGVIVAPGLARDITAKIAAELGDDLRALDTGVDWRTELPVDRLVAPPVQTTEIDAARRKQRSLRRRRPRQRPRRSHPCHHEQHRRRLWDRGRDRTRRTDTNRTGTPSKRARLSRSPGDPQSPRRRRAPSATRATDLPGSEDEHAQLHRRDCAKSSSRGWSLYGAPWLQPVAISSKSADPRNRKNKRNPLPPAA
jgi:hypothetical protein